MEEASCSRRVENTNTSVLQADVQGAILSTTAERALRPPSGRTNRLQLYRERALGYAVHMTSMHPPPLSAHPFLLPLAGQAVAAGFPSPAEDHAVERIDLMEQIVRHPQATFFLRVRGDSMREAGILDGSVVVVDRALRPRHGQIVIAVVDGEFTCKRLHQPGRAGRMRLRAENPTYPDITPHDGQTVEIWGVVVACIQQFPVGP